ncbi:hypothetical protein KC316_g171 [Hortaea werneckii]|nr:hypothetical protein KC324_g234 [Hortaea werneckii]KAI7595938.1 hypothetical protein KC316_g171 [Hortaea werneckii]
MMKDHILRNTFLVGLLADVVFSQQLQGATSYLPYSYLQPACLQALNTGVACPRILDYFAERGSTADEDATSALCVNSCLTSLNAARDTIVQACKADDTVVIDDVAYPATFFADSYLLAYEKACRKDRSYVVQASDTCNSVAASLGVSTYNLLTNNGLNVYCHDFNDTVGSELCVPETCELHTWRYNDTCAGVVSRNVDITIPRFLAWNANFNGLCGNAGGFDGFQVCVGPPGGFSSGSAPSDPVTTGTATAALPAPTNAASGTSRECGLWYTVQAGDTCGQVSVANSIALTDFYFLNPSLDVECTNLLLGSAYCVKAVGDIASYSGYTPSGGASITVPRATFSSVNTAIITATPVGYSFTQSLMPTASGTIEGCTDYSNHNASANRSGDCRYIAFAWQISTSQLIEWNPSLDSDLSICSLQDGRSYCVGQEGVVSDNTPTSCQPVDSSDILDGTISKCNCFASVKGYYSGDYLCGDLSSDYFITVDELTTWNTWLSTDCDSSLYKDLEYGCTRPVCVGVNTSAPVGTATSSPGGSLHPTRTTATVSLGPTASGVIAGCAMYHTVQSVDSCSNIETMYSVSFVQLHAWNPSIGDKCENLWLGYAYCVDGPVASGKPSSAADASAPAPTRSGTASNCKRFHEVVSGDSCAKIGEEYDVSFAQLYDWNPTIGSNCQNLWIGYAICVGS